MAAPLHPSALDPDVAARLRRDARGLVTAVVQQWDTGEVLMVGWMDDEALHRTLTSGRATYWSRSRNQYWRKGDTSGHAQYVKEVRLDCDGDALLVRVDQVGVACHTGGRTCFDGRVLVSRMPDSGVRGSQLRDSGVRNGGRPDSGGVDGGGLDSGDPDNGAPDRESRPGPGPGPGLGGGVPSC